VNLLLDINQKKGTTCIMVTHNADLECYADRILYVGDGRFQRQAYNRVQTRLNHAAYLAYLNDQTR
jgi:putative ABC transport system ATP-binding protein